MAYGNLPGAALLDSAAMSLAPGSRLGPYEIVSSLGAGGMGEVWRARDTRLGRDVAVKVLAAHLSAEPEVRARFEREARAISALNHPHVCVLHDVGRDGDTDYLVMELVEGETLAKRLKRGPLPLADVLRIGTQIADALDRAHRAGIVHRDLKPGNVMLAKSGAKLMDFGLARAHGDGAGPLRSGSSDLSISPTMSRPLTAEGSIVGTFQYMAPEQLEGGEADARSDVWSFGCLLYEMLTGKPAFEGRSAASLISAIMKEEPPPIASSRPGVAPGELPPPELERLVRRCLAKDADERWQSAADLKHELQWLGSDSVSGSRAATVSTPVAPARPPRAWASGWIVGAVGLLVAAASLIVPRLRPPTAGVDAVLRLQIDEIPGMQLLTPAEAALSDDATRIAFAAVDSNGTGQLYVRDLASTEVRLVPGVVGARLPFWSPDGRWLAYFAGGNLCKIPIEGGAPVILCAAPDARGGAWSPRGVIVFAPRAEGALQRVSAEGGTPRDVTELDRAAGVRSQRYPAFLPDGRHFLYTGVRGHAPHPWYVGDIDGGPSRRIGEGATAPVWSPTGNVLWCDNWRILARPFDPGSARLSGEPRLLVNDVFTDNFGYPNVTAAGRLLFVQRFQNGPVHLDWAPRDGGAEVPATSLAIPALTNVSVSHDGRQVVYDSRQNGVMDLWLQALSGGPPVRLTSEPGFKAQVAWSADDRRVLYSRASGSGGYEVRVLDLETGADTLCVRPQGTFAFANEWLSDGSALLSCTDSTGNWDTYVATTDGSGAMRCWRHTRRDEIGAFLSHDGRWIVLLEQEDGNSQIAIEAWPGPGPRVVLSTRAYAGGALAPSGNEIDMVDNSGAVDAIPIVWGPPVRFGTPHRIAREPAGFTVIGFSENPRGLLIARRSAEGRVSTLEGIANWPRLLEHP